MHGHVLPLVRLRVPALRVHRDARERDRADAGSGLEGSSAPRVSGRRCASRTITPPRLADMLNSEKFVRVLSLVGVGEEGLLGASWPSKMGMLRALDQRASSYRREGVAS